MKKGCYLLLALCLVYAAIASGQGMHFSQYYNAPLLLNPANTALMPDNDYRVGINYRNQWSLVPVPYNTFSAFGDFKVGGKKSNEDHNNWLGVGFAFFNDNAGSGNLALNQVQGSLAYHLQLSPFTMLSAGLSGAYVQRSVNYDNLTFDTQWDGYTFNNQLANGEKVGIIKTSYYTVGAGLDFAWFPNENVYAKLGASMLNINQPTESFYGSNNQLNYRPIADLDILVRSSEKLIINPSIYFTTQSGASELVFGSQFRTLLGENDNHLPTQLILGIYDRLNDAVIGVAGIQVAQVQFMVNYDFTVSALAPYNASYGALEFSLIYQGLYNRNKQGAKKMYSCPRFF
jgi:type IX secretion system PorP/SprF family membrane protein